MLSQGYLMSWKPALLNHHSPGLRYVRLHKESLNLPLLLLLLNLLKLQAKIGGRINEGQLLIARHHVGSQIPSSGLFLGRLETSG